MQNWEKGGVQKWKSGLGLEFGFTLFKNDG